ncbi:MAG: hotdog domain-containing protein [Actinomycetota bacterium]
MTDETGREALDRVLLSLYPTAEIDGVTATARFEPQPEHRGNPGWLQGGLAAAVLDHVCARAAAAALDARVVTATLDLRYRRPVAIADGPYTVRAEAAANRPRSRMVRVVGAILGPDTGHLVEAKALFVVRPGG